MPNRMHKIAIDEQKTTMLLWDHWLSDDFIQNILFFICKNHVAINMQDFHIC